MTKMDQRYIELVKKIYGQDIYFDRLAYGMFTTGITINDLLEIDKDLMSAFKKLETAFDDLKETFKDKIEDETLELRLVITVDGEIGVTFTT